ncbi:MAG: class I SAM-dependent RNA methyltransferase [Desulforhopalus sp.]
MRLETINITKIVNGGYGFAYLSNGQVALVRHVLPNEKVIINIEEAKKNYLFGTLQQILEGHPSRIIPPCKYYRHCGGCDLQHCNYVTQVALKNSVVEELLQRQSREAVRESVHLLAPPLPSPSEFAYRQRIRLQVGNRGVVGFRRFHSHDIIPIDACLLAGESINRAITALQKHEDGGRLCELSTEVELQLNPQSGKTVCIFHFSRKIRPADAESAKRLCRDTVSIERIFFIGTDFPITGPYSEFSHTKHEKTDNKFVVDYPATEANTRPLSLSWEAGGFCQVNLDQNIQLIETVINFCQLEKTDTVLDLYCGMGNFAIPLARLAKNVFGIEGQASAIRSARINAAEDGQTNTCFLKSPVHNGCVELAQKNQRFDCVLIDPPRQGAPDLADHLAAITTKRLVYISCDPATLCRDLAALTEQGFIIKKIQPVDMFPQTHHVETVVLLEK